MKARCTTDEAAIDRLELELRQVHACVDVLGIDRLLWLRDAFADRAARLSCGLESARWGWPSDG